MARAREQNALLKVGKEQSSYPKNRRVILLVTNCDKRNLLTRNQDGRVTPEQYLEYLLIAENVERRGQAETDPIKKARIAGFLKEYWGIRNGVGRNLGQNGLGDIAEAIGENERTTKRLLKLNDLIPELQQLVSDGKLGTTAAEQLAYLTEDEQRALFDALGESVAKTTVAEAGEIKQEARRRL